MLFLPMNPKNFKAVRLLTGLNLIKLCFLDVITRIKSLHGQSQCCIFPRCCLIFYSFYIRIGPFKIILLRNEKVQTKLKPDRD